jgi:hypothetical protein
MIAWQHACCSRSLPYGRSAVLLGRFAVGGVQVHDHAEFACIWQDWFFPNNAAAQTEAPCTEIRDCVERSAEPFGAVDHSSLERFLSTSEGVR